MKRLALLASAASLLAIANAAQAADPQAEVAEPGFDWSGFYAGIGVGAGGVVHELSTPFLGGISFNGIGGEGVFGEAVIGYDYMVSQRLLLGAFADVRLGNIGTSLDVPGAGVSASIDANTVSMSAPVWATSSRRTRSPTFWAAIPGRSSTSIRMLASPATGMLAAMLRASAWKRPLAGT